MNIFGAGTADGNGRLLNRIVVAGFVCAGAAIASVIFLDHAARDGTLARLAPASQSNYAQTLMSLPQSQERGPVGVRYGGVDYMPTASIPASQQRIKNVVADPSLGMPQ